MEKTYNSNKNNNNSNEEVAIIGIGFRLPGVGNGKADELWNQLLDGFDGVVETTERWSDNFCKSGEIASKYAGLLSIEEWKSFDPLFFGISPKEAESIDVQQRLLLKCVWEAIEDSYINPLEIRGSNTSVYVGCSTVDYQNANSNSNDNKFNIFGFSLNSISNRISHCYDLHGTSMTIDTACSSSLNAVTMGYKSIISGDSNLSIACGTNLILDPKVTKSFSYLNMLGKSGKCKSFDEDADGYVRAEGCGVIIMKSLKQAIKDGNNIYCVINGASSNSDGAASSDKSNFLSPSKSLQSDNIKLALSSTNGTVSANDIDYVEAHGTGTPTGDPIELEGISMALNTIERNYNNPLLIGTIKSNIGHCEAASGVASVIKCCLMFKHECFAPNIHFNKPNPLIKFDEWNLKVVTKPIPFSSNKSIKMAINNFGITGSNCCLLLSQPPKRQLSNIIQTDIVVDKRMYLIPFSANSVESLIQYQTEFRDLQTKDISFNEYVKNQILLKPQQLVQRSVIIASDWDEFINKSNTINTSNENLTLNMSLSSNKKNSTTVFVFCGQGSQYQTMGKQLYENEPIFKNSMDLIDNKLSKYYRYSILKKLRSINENDRNSINDPFIAQPSTCMIQISLFELYKHWGIIPSFIIGHSLGEISASYCSGMIDLDTFCYLIYNRSMFQSKTNGSGKMLSIGISKHEFQSTYSSKYPTIEIACYNSPSSIVIAGDQSLLNEISLDLNKNGKLSTMLGSLSSFHTSSQLIIKDDILNLSIKSQPSKIPTFSTTTTNLFNSYESFNSEYVFDNIIKPVLFEQTISNLYNHIELNDLGKDVVFIEIGPHPTLQYHLKQMIPINSNYFTNAKESITIYSPLSKKSTNDLLSIQQTISKLYCQGYKGINFECQLNGGNKMVNYNINLPLYQWGDTQFWKIDSFFENYLENGSPVDTLGNSSSMYNPLTKSYQTFIDTKSPAFKWLKGHMFKSKNYFPGFGYIDNILKLNTSGDNDQQLPNITISSIEFKSPLILQEGIKTCLQTNIYPTGKKEFKALFHYKDNKTNQWVHSSSANYQLFNSSNSNDIKYNINEIISKQCNYTKLSKSELYDYIKSKVCLQYSGSFQCVQECYLGDNCSLSIVTLNNSIDDESTSFFNTSIMDSCLHGAVGQIKHQCQIVLERVEGLTYYSSKIPLNRSKHQNVYVYSKLNSIFGDSYMFSIIVLLIDGTILYEIDNVVCTSTIPIKDSLTIEYPTNQLYSKCFQPKDTPLSTPSSFDNFYKQNQSIINPDKINNAEIFISALFYESIVSRVPEITINQINSIGIDKLILKYCNGKDIIYQRLFTFVFETIIQYYNSSLSSDQFQIHQVSEHYHILIKSSKIISKLLFPIDDEDKSIDTPQSLFEDGLLEQVYSSKNYVHSQNKIVADIIEQSIKQLLNEKMVFRIIEFGGGICSLSLLVLDQINTLLINNPNYQIDIEYTWSDISPSFIPDAKIKFSKYHQRMNIIYKSLNLEKQLIGDNEQELNPSYYDFVIMSNVLHVIKDVKYGIDQIYNILTPNGQLLFVEPQYKSLIGDTIFGVFDQWWSFEDISIRQDRCCMKQDTWSSLLKSCNFNNDIKMSNDSESICFVIQAQKPSLLQQPLINQSNDKIMIFKNEIDQPSSIKFMQCFNDKDNIQIISNITNFKSISSSITNSSIIYFIKSMDQLNIDNFKEITFEFIQINQILLELNIYCKIVLITRDSQTTNYLSSSLFGVAKYFEKDLTFKRKIQMFTLNFDSTSILENQNLGQTIESLISPNLHIQREFLIENNQVYFERLKCETNSFKSDSFIKFDDVNKFKVSLSPNLEYQLELKPNKLKPYEIEVQVMATGLNYKDYLIYAGLLPREMVNHNGDINKPEFGSDFSGIITRMGNKAINSEYKIGDHVYGISINTASSHIITHLDYICKKPNNITHVQSSSIPVVYVTSYHSLYNIGGLKNEESILIHSATGGVGLSTLEILKWKKHSGLIFVTVGSIEKEQYLLNNYGDMITGIYSTRNKDYVNQIKLKVKELNNDEDNESCGIDLILNTLSSSDYMDSNFKCLNIGGRIVDLSITHLNSNEYIENKKFKYNYGYHNVELLFISKSVFNSTFKIISSAIENEELNYKIPLIEYSNEQVKGAIEFINQRKHIGKVIINQENNNIVNKLIETKLQDNNRQSTFTNLKTDYHIQPSLLGKNIIITGQTGIVLEILKWILRYSVNGSIENIIILSKSSIKWELELLINKTTNSINNSIKFHFKSIDIGNTEILDKTISNILNDNPSITNIDSIFHFAFTQIACVVNEIDINHLNVSHGAKVMGAINLHEQSINRNWKLINFIMASSIASINGSTDQCGYVAANLILDNLSKYRKSIGLPSICTNYGLIQSTGFVYRNESIGAMLGGEGLNPLSTNSILGLLDLQLQNEYKSTNLLFCDYNFNSLVLYDDSLSKLDYQINLVKQNKKVVSSFKSVEKAKESIINKISELLSIDSSKINQDIKLIDYGADSMLIVNLKNFIDKEFQIPLAITIQQINNNTIKDFIQFITIEIDKQKLK